MTCKELIDLLSKYNPETRVILSRDPEGNTFSEVEELTFEPHNDEVTENPEEYSVIIWPQ